MTEPTAATIWKTLSRVDCRDKIDKKGSLSYLSWAWAWGILMEHYPDAVFEFSPERTFPDGSVETVVTITIGTTSRQMTLPVMDNRNNSVINPSSRQVNDTRMRCLVKCLALFGLGHFIYAGEDLPMDAVPEPPAIITAEQAATVAEMLEQTGSDTRKFCQAFRCDAVETLPASAFAPAMKALREKVRRLKKDQAQTADSEYAA